MGPTTEEPPEFKRLKEIADPFLRRLYFVGILTKYLPSAARPVVVGGHAVEFHTGGRYATGDIDLACPDRRALGDLLASWGFEHEARHWHRADLDLYVEAPADGLEPEQSSRLTQADVEDLSAFILGPEDVILDRLNAFVHWKYAEDGLWAEQIARIYAERLDWDYLQTASARDETAAALEQIRQRLEVERGQKS